MEMNGKNSERKRLQSYRDEFPITKRFVYLDHAGVAPVPIRVRRAVEEYTKEAAESAMFSYEKWTARVEEVRKQCALLTGGESEEIAFVKNTSHGLSMIAEGLDWKEGDNLILFEKEFPSNVYPWLNLQRKGVEIKFVQSSNGKILIEDIERLIDSRTRLVTISSVQFSNGFRVDLKKLGMLCKGKGILFCVDAIQSLGVVPMTVREYQVDFLSADGHKWLLAPEGTGIFYCRKEIAERLNPPLIGWKSVRNELDYDKIAFELKTNALRFEEGSFSFMGISALGAAVELLLEVGVDRILDRVLELGNLIIGEAEKRGFDIRTPKERQKRAGIVSFIGDFEPNEVMDKLKALGVMIKVRGGAIRLSPHFYNTEDDIMRFFEAMDSVARV